MLWRSSGMRQQQKKGGYEHFMLKEIHEQPKAVQDTIGAYVKDGHVDLSETGLTDESWLLLRGLPLLPAVPLITLEWLANM